MTVVCVKPSVSLVPACSAAIASFAAMAEGTNLMAAACGVSPHMSSSSSISCNGTCSQNVFLSCPSDWNSPFGAGFTCVYPKLEEFRACFRRVMTSWRCGSCRNEVSISVWFVLTDTND
ncbi:hypothetical protein V6N13_041952 [Hibiscus sabdariffa]